MTTSNGTPNDVGQRAVPGDESRRRHGSHIRVDRSPALTAALLAITVLVAAFALYSVHDDDRYRTGSSFAVAYDPTEPAGNAFPGDPGETSAQGDLIVPIALAGVGAALLVLWWAGRGVLFLVAARRPARPHAGSGSCGTRLSSSMGRSTC